MEHNEIIIRTAEETDAAALLSIYAPYVERTAITFEYEVPSLQEFAGASVTSAKNIPTSWRRRTARCWAMPTRAPSKSGPPMTGR